jgi:ABC-type Fe3+/spermidine/putrescine transport system ATPase subunit
MTAALALSDVTFRYGQTALLDHLDLSVADGEILVLLGPSGSGKSTVIRILLGFAAPESGRVEVSGEVVSVDARIRVPPEERNLTVVFQDLALWPHLSVRANLAFGLDSQRADPGVRDRRIAEVLEQVALAGKEHRYPGELSGGEQQRAAIARALVLEPRAVLLDEPLTNLDAHLKRQLLTACRTWFRQRRTSVLYVTHDIREAAALADRIAVLEGGRIVQQGTLQQLREGPATTFINALLADLTWPGTSE